VLAVAAGVWMLTPPRGLAVRFQPFDEQRITQANRAGQVVLVDFTASWCLSCKVVDYLVYDRPETAQELSARDVLALRGDVTSADAPANHLLYERLRGAPPLTVIFPPSGPPIRLEGKFSRQDLLRALDEAPRR
jgi:thiol:disulfide interchange protein